jgi:O-antigen/teichoic acid export membrane protein
MHEMIDPGEDKYRIVAQKATKGMGWNFLSFGGTKLLTLATLFILAHILTPEDFGLVALATLTMDYLSVVSDLGFGAALIQKKDNVEEHANTAFTINLVANTILTIVVIGIAPYAAAFFREPSLIPILRWLSAIFIIKSIGTIQNVLLERELNFRKKMIADLGNSVIKAIVSIILAWQGFGVWSLVAGQLAGVSTASVLLWFLSSWKPRFAWESDAAKKLFSYGLSIMGSNALTAWEDNFDYLIIGRIFDATALGIYTVAYRLPETLILNTLWLMTSVLFPTFSALQDHKDSLKRGFLSTVHYVELLVVPVCFGMFITANPLIRVAFGEQWVGAIPILQIISLYTLVASIGFHAGDVYKAIGRPDILFKISLPMFPIRLLALWIGAQYGLIGVAFGHLVAEIIATGVNFTVIRHMINVTILEIILELKAFIGGIVLLLFAVPVLYLSENTSPIIQLFVTTAAGGIGYIGTIRLIDRDALMKVVQLTGLAALIKKNKNNS